MNDEDKLGLFTSRGRLLIQVIKSPGITTRELAKDLFLTRRSVWGSIGELRHMGYLLVKREGRKHHYSISQFGLSELRKLLEE